MTAGLDDESARTTGRARTSPEDAPYVACSLSDGRWVRMDHGNAANHWRPRAELEHVQQHAIAWTGGINIPEMAVLDRRTGQIVWEAPPAPPLEHDDAFNQEHSPQGTLF